MGVEPMYTNPALDKKTELFGAWSGMLYVILLCFGWWLIPGYIPPHDPSASADEIAQIYVDQTLSIRVGMVIIMFAAMIYIPFTAALAKVISRIEGGVGILTFSQALAGLGNAILTFYPPLWWLTAAFRPEERDAELIYLLSDAAWLQFIGGITLFLPVLITIAVAALHDKQQQPVFPRWFAFYSLWTFVLMLPGQLCVFFKTGPFAWNGLMAFWVPLCVFSFWFMFAFHFLRADVNRRYAG